MSRLTSILLDIGMNEQDILDLTEDEEFAEALENALKCRPKIVREFPIEELEDWV